MKNAHEVLQQKEADLARVRQEVESLAIAAELLNDDNSSGFDSVTTLDDQSRKPAQKAVPPEPIGTESTGTEGEPFVWPRAGFWASLRFRR